MNRCLGKIFFDAHTKFNHSVLSPSFQQISQSSTLKVLNDYATIYGKVERETANFVNGNSVDCSVFIFSSRVHEKDKLFVCLCVLGEGGGVIFALIG